MFSIADLQQEPEQEEFEQEEDEEPASQISPIRCSISVTKVSFLEPVASLILIFSLVQRSWCFDYRCYVPRGNIHR